MGDWEQIGAKNLFDLLPKNFSKEISSNKWSERRDCLQKLLDNLAETPNLLANVKYNQLIDQLRKVAFGDSNVIVVSLAIRVFGSVAGCLRTAFTDYVPLVLTTILEKFKEKKAVVKDSIVDCIDAISRFCQADALVPYICDVLERTQNPSVKLNTYEWIYRILLCYYEQNKPMRFINRIFPFVIQHSSDSDSNVREASFMVLGGICRLIGEEFISSKGFASEKPKVMKIMHFSQKAEEQFRIFECDKKLASCITNDFKKDRSGGANKENHSILECKLVESDPWESYEETSLISQLQTEFYALVESQIWKDRESGLEILLNLLDKNPRLNPRDHHGRLVKVLSMILMKDANVIVASLAAKCLAKMAKALRYHFATFASMVFEALFYKFREKKNVLKESIIDCADSISVVTPLSMYVVSVDEALSSANPQTRAQTASFLARLFRLHNGQTLPYNELMFISPALLKLTSDPDLICRSAAYASIGAVMKSISAKHRETLFGDVLQDPIKSVKIKEEYNLCSKEHGHTADDRILHLCEMKIDAKFSDSFEGFASKPRVPIKNLSIRPVTAPKQAIRIGKDKRPFSSSCVKTMGACPKFTQLAPLNYSSVNRISQNSKSNRFMCNRDAKGSGKEQKIARMSKNTVEHSAYDTNAAASFASNAIEGNVKTAPYRHNKLPSVRAFGVGSRIPRPLSRRQ